jgi:hypothetical protein
MAVPYECRERRLYRVNAKSRRLTLATLALRYSHVVARLDAKEAGEAAEKTNGIKQH